MKLSTRGTWKLPSVNLLTLFPDSLKAPKWLTGTKCIFRIFEKLVNGFTFYISRYTWHQNAWHLTQ